MTSSSPESMFALAEEIKQKALIAADWNPYQALADLVGSETVADLYVLEWGSEVLALEHRAWELAEKEVEG